MSDISTSFDKDPSTGNMIIPRNAFNGHSDIIVTFAKNKGRDVYAVDVVSAIMAFEEKNQNNAGEVWRNRIKEKNKIQAGIDADDKGGTLVVKT
jgi:hypothetical protein